MIVIKKDLTVLNVTMKMDSAPVSQTFLATSVTDVLMDSMGSQTVEVGFNCQYFLNSYSYARIILTLIHRMQLYRWI